MDITTVRWTARAKPIIGLIELLTMKMIMVSTLTLGRVSTAAHHASAVTLNVGLGPRRGDNTRSGAEFDPERPLQNIMAGAEQLSMLGNNTTSKSIPSVGFFYTCAIPTFA